MEILTFGLKVVQVLASSQKEFFDKNFFQLFKHKTKYFRDFCSCRNRDNRLKFSKNKQKF